MPSPPLPSKPRKKTFRRILLGIGALFVGAILIFIVAPLTWWSLTAPEYDGYNYHTYRLIDSNRNYIEAGKPFPANLDVYTPDGNVVPVHRLWQDKPLVLETASNSCPIYWEGEVNMSTIANTYKDKANVIILYTREAHPGMLAPSHRTIEAKLKQARKMEGGVSQSVLVDDVKGTLHAQLGSGPNSVYIVGTDGIVAHYSYWNDPSITKEKLQALLDAGGTSESLELSTNPCRDPSRALANFDAETMKTMSFGIINAGGIDALVDFMTFMFTAEGGEDPLCELVTS